MSHLRLVPDDSNVVHGDFRKLAEEAVDIRTLVKEIYDLAGDLGSPLADSYTTAAARPDLGAGSERRQTGGK